MEKILYVLGGLFFLLNLKEKSTVNSESETIEAPALPFFSAVVQNPVMRNDTEGAGYFQASRGSRKHEGVDIEVVEGQGIYSPIEGKFKRNSYPYSGDLSWEGLIIEGTGRHEGLEVTIWYMMPYNFHEGEEIAQGQAIGTAQAISKRYSPRMKDHIHIELRHFGELEDPSTMLFT